jgi:hypothetical protein
MCKTLGTATAIFAAVRRLGKPRPEIRVEKHRRWA